MCHWKKINSGTIWKHRGKHRKLHNQSKCFFLKEFGQRLPGKALALQRNASLHLGKQTFRETGYAVRPQTRCLNMCSKRSKFVTKMQK